MPAVVRKVNTTPSECSPEVYDARDAQASGSPPDLGNVIIVEDHRGVLWVIGLSIEG